MFSQQSPYGERDSASRANALFIHSYLSESPVKELSRKMEGKHTVAVHRAASGQNAYIKWGAAWFPKGIIYNTAITTSVPYRL